MGLHNAPKVFRENLKIPIKTYFYNHFSYIRGVDWGGGHQAQDEGEEVENPRKLEARDWLTFTRPSSWAGDFK